MHMQKFGRAVSFLTATSIIVQDLYYDPINCLCNGHYCLFSCVLPETLPLTPANWINQYNMNRHTINQSMKSLPIAFFLWLADRLWVIHHTTPRPTPRSGTISITNAVDILEWEIISWHGCGISNDNACRRYCSLVLSLFRTLHSIVFHYLHFCRTGKSRRPIRAISGNRAYGVVKACWVSDTLIISY